MRLTERLRHAVLRWNRLGLALVLAMPVIVSSVLGFVWLYERGWLLWFALASVGLYAAVRLGVMVARWRTRGALVADPRDLKGPEPDPEWSVAERATFERARERINTRLSEPIPWTDLPTEALAVVEEIAADVLAGTGFAQGGEDADLGFALRIHCAIEETDARMPPARIREHEQRGVCRTLRTGRLGDSKSL